MTRSSSWLAAKTFALLITLAACSDMPDKKKEAEKPAEPVTGRFALHQMYVGARAWSPDIQIRNLESIHLSEVKAPGGKAGAWRATFVSTTLQQSRTYTYSVINASPTLRKGVYSENPLSGTGSGRSFPLAALQRDSDEAYEKALKAKGAAEYDRKNPGMNIMLLLAMNPQFPDATWRVIWGESVSSSSFSVVVDASTGQVLETLH